MLTYYLNLKLRDLWCCSHLWPGNFAFNLLCASQTERFTSMSTNILGRIDELGARIDDLEKQIEDMVQGSVEEEDVMRKDTLQ